MSGSASIFSPLFARKRRLASLFGTVFILFQLPGFKETGSTGEFLFDVVLIVLFTGIFWFQNLKKSAYVLLTLLLVGGLAFQTLYFHVNVNNSLLLTLFVYVALRFDGWLSITLALIIGVVMGLLILSAHSMNWRGAVILFFGMIGYYAGAKGFRSRQVAFRLSQQHLEELKVAHQELQEASVRSMQYAVLEERNRIARDIHDSLGHSLTSLIVQLQALPYMMPDAPPVAQETVQNMLTVAKRSLREIRSSVHTLADDKTQGITPLRAFLSQVEAHTGLTCTFAVDPQLGELPASLSVTLFRILQEATTNAVRHAGASRLDVTIRQAGDGVTMIVEDDGRLQPDEAVTPGFGLSAMRERLEAMGGTLQFAAREPHGFRIHADIPLRQDSALSLEEV